jgi:hypothetical protein
MMTLALRVNQMDGRKLCFVERQQQACGRLCGTDLSA